VRANRQGVALIGSDQLLVAHDNPPGDPGLGTHRDPNQFHQHAPMIQQNNSAETAALIVEIDELAKTLERTSRTPKFRARIVVPHVKRLASRTQALRLGASMCEDDQVLRTDLNRVSDSLRQVRLLSQVSRTDTTWLATLLLIDSYLGRLRPVFDTAQLHPPTSQASAN